MISTEAAILKAIFPPAGAIPLNRVDDLGKIQAHISAIIDLSTGYRPVASAPRVCDPTESNHLTTRIVELRESAEGMSLSWPEIAARIGGLTDAACRKRYAAYCARMIAAAALDGKRQEIEQVPGRAPLQEAKPEQPEKATIREGRMVEESATVAAPPSPPGGAEQAAEYPAGPEVEEPKESADDIRARASTTPREAGHRIGPKIPHTKDEFIDRRRAGGARYRSIQAELNAQGIKCNVDDVIARHHDYMKKERKAAGKKQHNAPTPKEEGRAQATTTEAPAEQPPASPDQSGCEKPGPKSIARAELDARIWAAWKAGKTPDEISDELYAEGLYYSEKSVRVRLISQGAEL